MLSRRLKLKKLPHGYVDELYLMGKKKRTLVIFVKELWYRVCRYVS